MTIAIISDAVADVKALLAKLEGSAAVQAVDNDVKTAAKLAWNTFTSSLPADLVALAGTVLAGMTGSPWPAVIDALITEAKAIGHSLEASEAAVLLNYVQSNGIVQGTIPTPTATTAASATTPAA